MRDRYFYLDGCFNFADMTRKYINRKDRRTELLSVAIELAELPGMTYMDVTRQQIAEKAGCSTGLVSHTLGTMNNLRKALMRYAVSHKHYKIIAQGLVRNDSQAMKVDELTKTCAMQREMN